MVVGLLRLQLHLPACNSLKEKRSVLKRLFAHLRRTHNVGVAELDHQDVWRSAQIGVVTLANEHTLVEQMLTRVAAEVVGTDGVEVTDQALDLL